ncbi:MAG: rhodanese-like domain-containing protein [Rhodoglobus sp.]
MSEITTVIAEEAVALVANGMPLVDVREQDEWDTIHAPEAVLIPLSQLRERLADLPEGRFLVMCHSGGRSARAVDFLAREGYDAVNVDGGIMAWPHAGGATVPAA